MNASFSSFYLSINSQVLKLLPLHSLFRHLYLLVFCGLDDVWTWFSLNLSCFAFTKLLEICNSVSFTKFGNSSAFMFSNIFFSTNHFLLSSSDSNTMSVTPPILSLRSLKLLFCFVLFSLPNGSFILIYLQAC